MIAFHMGPAPCIGSQFEQRQPDECTPAALRLPCSYACTHITQFEQFKPEGRADVRNTADVCCTRVHCISMQCFGGGGGRGIPEHPDHTNSALHASQRAMHVLLSLQMVFMNICAEPISSRHVLGIHVAAQANNRAEVRNQWKVAPTC